MIVEYLDIFRRNEKAKNFVVCWKLSLQTRFCSILECERAQMLREEIAQAGQKLTFDGSNSQIERVNSQSIMKFL